MARCSSLVAFALVAAACGVKSPPPTEPDPTSAERAFTRGNSGEPAEEPAKSAAPVPAPSEYATGATGTAPAPPEPAAPSEGPPEVTKPTRPPTEIVTAPRVAFMINYPASAPKEAADKKCSAGGDDPGARAICLDKERERFLADVLVFKQNDQKRWLWVVYRRKSSTLLEVSTTPVELVPDTDRTLKLKMTGAGKGARPLFPSAKEVTLTFPSDSTIELADPVFGHLVYEARIGLVGD